jgi:hypothetical protein
VNRPEESIQHSEKGESLKSRNITGYFRCYTLWSSLLSEYPVPSIQINQPTKWNKFSSLLLDFYIQRNVFRGPHAHHQELNNCSSSLWFYRWGVVVAVLMFVGPTTTIRSSTTAVAASGFTVGAWW